MKNLITRSLIFGLVLSAAIIVGKWISRPKLTIRTTAAPKSSVMEKPDQHLAGRLPAGALAKLPLRFERFRRSKGDDIQFLSHGLKYSFFLSSDRAIVVSPFRGPLMKENDVLTLQWLGASDKSTKLIGLGPQRSSSNYFAGKNPAKWQKRIAQFDRVERRGLFEGVDLAYYGSQQELEFDLSLHPGADPKSIHLGVGGAFRVELAPEGDVAIHMRGGEVRLRQPNIYQVRNGGRQAVSGHYVLLAKNEVGIEVGPYDHNASLVIDPILSYQMAFGGAAGFSNDLATDIAIDNNGNAYVTGVTCSPNFPVTPQALQPNGGLATNFGFNCKDGFVTKINSTATSLIYSTYIGGSGIDAPSRIAVDQSGNVYLTGGTMSSDFPVTAGAYDTKFKSGSCTSPIFSGCSDGFVSKISADGSSLVYSTYLGGSGTDFGIGVAVDGSGNAYIAGATNSNDFPTSSNAFQKQYGGGTCNSAPCMDGFATKLSADGSSLVYSTYLGGNDDDFASGIAVDSQGTAYLAGGTGSLNFPVTANAFQPTHGGTTDQTDGFVLALNPSGSQLLYSSFFGGSETDFATQLALDPAGKVYLTGSTGSSDFPTTSGAFQKAYGGPTPALCAFQVSNATSIVCGDAFVAKMDLTRSGAASLVWSTYLGGSNEDDGLGIAVDQSSNVWITGEALSNNFPTTPDAYIASSSFGGAYLAELGADGSKLLFSTYLSTSGGNDFGSAVAVDIAGNAYVTGQTSPPLTDTPAVYQTTGNDFVLKFSPGAAPAVSFSQSQLEFGDQPVNSTSATQSVMLTNTGSGPLSLAISIPSGNYSEVDNCGSSLAASASCTIQITFAPTSVGDHVAFLKVADNAPGSPQQISLDGTGTNPPSAAVVSPASLNFGNQGVSTNSLAQNITLSNAGSTSVNISGITTTPAFSEKNNCGNSLSANSSCTISVSFSPTSTGRYTGVLSVTDNAVGGLQTVALNGYGVNGPAVSLAPASLTFPPIAPAYPSPTRSIVLTNSGNALLDITGVLLKGPFTETTTCGATLNAGTSCIFKVGYKPAVPGPSIGSLIVGTNATGSPNVVTLTGLGPAITIPGSINFGSVMVGQSSSPQTETVNNSGTSPLLISSIAIGGNDPGDFAVAAGSTCHNGIVLQPLTFCNLKLVFTPSAQGSRSATVIFMDNAANSPQVTNLFGFGK